jgi:type IV secretion system protein TrbL
MRRRALLLLPCLIVLAASPAAAGVLDGFVSEFRDAGSDWYGKSLSLAFTVFTALAVLELTFTVLGWGFAHLSGRMTGGTMLAQLVRKVAVLGFFLAMIQGFPYFLPRFVQTFEFFGAHLGGTTFLSPSAFIETGFRVAGSILGGAILSGVFDPAVLTLLFLIAGTFFVCHVLLAYRLVMILVQATLQMAGLCMFLGFSSNRVTVSLAENYIVSCIRLGIHAMLLGLFLALGQKMSADWTRLISIVQYFDVVAIPLLLRTTAEVLIFTLLTMQVPGRLAYELTAPGGFLRMREALVGN